MSSWIEYTAPTWRDLQMRELKVDEAYVVPRSDYYDITYIYMLSEKCYTCPYSRVKAVFANCTEKALKFNTAHATSFKIFDRDVGRYAPANVTSLCSLTHPMQEFGVYNLSIGTNGSCAMITDKPGVNVNLSILTVILLCMLLTTITKLSKRALVKCRSSSPIARKGRNPEVQKNSKKPTKKCRMRSLDAFRGLGITLMIFGNTGGGGYWWTKHAPWNGLHPADVVFPWFVWIMGVCIPLSIKSQLSTGWTKKLIFQKTLTRSIRMFTVGICLNSISDPQMANLRIMGVLQRFGIAFLVVATIHTLFLNQDSRMPEACFKRSIFDLILMKEQIIFMILLIAASLGIMFKVNAPGCPRGYLGPGGKDSFAAYLNCTGGIVGLIDRTILGDSHIYQYSRARDLYDSMAFDPEGVFGCLLTVVQVMFGVICGSIITTHEEWIARFKRWLVWATGLGLLGGILCSFSEHDGWIPLNKNLWSLSFVLVTSSMAFCLLSILYYIIDVQQAWTGYPFTEAGMNAIIIYIGHIVFHQMLPWHRVIGDLNTHFVILLYCIWQTFLWLSIAIYMDSIKFYYTL